MRSVPTLEVDIGAIIANYRLLQQRHVTHSIAAVVKANAYGLGMEAVSSALHSAGCRSFFVATLGEGIALRNHLPDAEIGVFNGLLAGEKEDYRHYRLLPVLNDLGQVERAGNFPAILHIDTGMTRLGVGLEELPKVNIAPLLIMSHLACANTPTHPLNLHQLARFHTALAQFPGIKTSLANSSGLFLGPEFHFDLGRPGCALYGINPTDGKNPMRQVARLTAPLLQVRKLENEESVGYGATYIAPKGSMLAVVALGYADGLPRLLSNNGIAHEAGYEVPVVGRVSMDMIVLNVSTVPVAKLTQDMCAEFIGQQTVDEVALATGTIGYEIFTSIGQRVERLYKY